MASADDVYEGKPLTQLWPTEDRPGWRGFIEWEDRPDRKKIVHELLKRRKFPYPPEFQFVPLPKTNPILDGERFKAYHAAVGLSSIVDFSWETVLKEKPNMIHLLQFPYNGETRREDLIAGKITDNKVHFIRNHGGVPDIDEDALEISIGGLVNKPVKLTMKDLKDPNKFPQTEVTITLQCAGTRRREQIEQYPGDGDELINAPWGEGAIGTAVYKGVPLKKVLKIACGGVLPECQHIEFIGADTYFKKGDVFNYAVSVPYRKVRRNEEVLLAWEMNGKPLPKIHGFPLRAVVAGYIGARSVKWLYKINALAEPSLGPVQRQEYIYYTSQMGKQNVTYSNGFSIQDMPVSSAIIFPLDKTTIVHDGTIELQGWAYSGGGNWVERVEVSPDGGHVWYQVAAEDMTEKHYYAWRLWKTKLPVDAEGWLEFCVRTWDSSCNTEPTFVRSAWNWDLHVTSSAHRIKVYSVNRTKPATAKRLKELEEHGETIEPITRPLSFPLEDHETYQANTQKYPREPKN
ncbi:molybdopterin binding oxidoreductase [Gloeophyllum trabeum ATCC 11539]|uniref:Molybdopterin binding oxidoreductase n=1 Tax=Gloeophyllum trabeum (strain ATCC 11539 / FP-39264 / Madison 617) TaxID=670483 RepID=S7PYY9_GLOTA|nr:molybdopterin binding oxidoreductase [Gloeophyllum trabeum ATCC 11539]EPQ52866.1 molybdopterin binding oxidoreductase [Gloeophyllum trabeum ATCC 11539]